MKNTSLLFLPLFFFFTTALSQNPNWIVYDTTNSGLPSSWIYCITIDESNTKWIGSHTYLGFGGHQGDGLAKFDDLNWTVYNTSNSELQTNDISCIAIDDFDNKWIGTWYDGLALFDNTNWTVYDTSNSELPSNLIICIAIDSSGNKWIGTDEGLVCINDLNWTVYNTLNSGLPDNLISCIAIDELDNKWIGSGGRWSAMSGSLDGKGFTKFDGSNWSVYDISNSEIPSNDVSCIAFDNSGEKWIGTWGGGLARFDDIDWDIFNTSNSDLPSNSVDCVVIDEYDNKWIGTFNGLAVFNEGGVVPVEFSLFTASAKGKEVTLSWSTATELNNQGFEVQRKFGSNDFATIGSVKGHGTITSPNNYTYTDKLIDAGKYFYRLKQIDYGGKYEYSQEIEVEVQMLDKYLLEQNYPNPFNPSTSIQYTISNRQFILLQVYDILGNEVKTLISKEMDVGHHSIDFNTSNLPSGVYFYQLRCGGFVATKKMILMK